jgi:surface-anchored protein
MPPRLLPFALFFSATASAEDIRVLVSNNAGARAHDPAVGAGYVVRPAPHVDLNVVWNPGNQTFTGGFRTDDETPSVQYGPEDALAYLPATGQRQRTNAATQYDFQGAIGDTFWVFPSSAKSSNDAFSLYLGFSAYGVARDGTFTDNRTRWTVHSVENLTTPSATAFYGYSVSAGSVNMQLILDPAYPNREMTMLANGHAHLNLLFKAPGMYRVTFRVRGTLAATSQQVASLVPVYFGVEEWALPSAAAPVIALSGDLAFGNVAVGQTAIRTLTISNSGNAPLTVNSITYPTGFSGNWSNGTIAADTSQNITVTFTPSAASDFSGNIAVTSNADSGTNTIAISGTGTPAAGTYNTWRLAEFSAPQAADPLVSGPNADPDLDGFTNLQEYAFGGDPLVPDAPLLQPRVEIAGGKWRLHFRQRQDASDLSFTVESTPSLAAESVAWSTQGISQTSESLPVDAPPSVDEVAFEADLPSSGQAFQRIRVQLAP